MNFEQAGSAPFVLKAYMSPKYRSPTYKYSDPSIFPCKNSGKFW